MLKLNQIELRRGARLLFQNATLQVHAGQRVGLIGVNGSGKSSLFALILGKLDSDAGELQVNPKDVIAHVAQQSPSGSASALDFVMDGDQGLRNLQAEIAALEAKDSQGESKEESKDSHTQRLHLCYEHMDTIDGYSAESRAARLLHGLGFAAEKIHSPVNEFSGGWRMRLNLAQALMCRSDILLLDEPTNHLDLPAIIWLEHWLKSYRGILMLISHDRDFLDGLCTHIVHIEHQTVKTYTGNYSQFEAVRAEQLALQQVMYVKQQREIKHIQSFVDKFHYKATKAKQAQSRLKMLERMALIAPAHVDSEFQFQFEEAEKQPQQLIELEDVTVGYSNTVVVAEINFRLNAGDRIGLLGANGAGKSTLVKALVDGDTLLKGNRAINKHTKIGYFAQHQMDLLHMDCSPLWHLQQISPTMPEQHLRNHLGHFGFHGERVDEPLAPFSGGEKARLVLALLLLQKPNLLLLDEPTNHLDLEMRHALSKALVEYNGALLVISHDRHLLRSVCDVLYVVHMGHLIEFKQSLDDYPAWLKSQAKPMAASVLESAAKPVLPKVPSKKQNRQAAARQRQLLKPLYDKIKKIEMNISQCRSDLRQVEASLQNESLYTDDSRQLEMRNLMQQQAGFKASLEMLEWDWLEANEVLEAAGMTNGN